MDDEVEEEKESNKETEERRAVREIKEGREVRERREGEVRLVGTGAGGVMNRRERSWDERDNMSAKGESQPPTQNSLLGSDKFLREPEQMLWQEHYEDTKFVSLLHFCEAN